MSAAAQTIKAKPPVVQPEQQPHPENSEATQKLISLTTELTNLYKNSSTLAAGNTAIRIFTHLKTHLPTQQNDPGFHSAAKQALNLIRLHYQHQPATANLLKSYIAILG